MVHPNMAETSPHRDPPTRFRFDDFEADLRSGELTRDGRRVHLPDKPFQLLTALLERPGEVVTRQELCDRMWPAVRHGDEVVVEPLDGVTPERGDAVVDDPYIDVSCSGPKMVCVCGRRVVGGRMQCNCKLKTSP